MSEIKFACPHCGQKMTCDSAGGGMQTACPSCQQQFLVPTAPVGAAAPPPPRQPTPRPAAPAPIEPPGYSGLAVGSFVCSLLPVIGWIPGIVCGHLARLRMRRNPGLQGRKLAMTGLIISYSLLGSYVSFLTYRTIYRHTHPISYLRDGAEEQKATAARSVDQVVFGDRSSEQNHNMEAKNSTTGPFSGKWWRGAFAGGSISYTMKVLPNRAMVLECLYWGNDNNGRNFDIVVEGQVIANQVLQDNFPGQFFEVEYPVPRALTKGKTEVKVEFRGHTKGTQIGGIFGCQILKW